MSHVIRYAGEPGFAHYAVGIVDSRIPGTLANYINNVVEKIENNRRKFGLSIKSINKIYAHRRSLIVKGKKAKAILLGKKIQRIRERISRLIIVLRMQKAQFKALNELLLQTIATPEPAADYIPSCTTTPLECLLNSNTVRLNAVVVDIPAVIIHPLRALTPVGVVDDESLAEWLSYEPLGEPLHNYTTARAAARTTTYTQAPESTFAESSNANTDKSSSVPMRLPSLSELDANINTISDVLSSNVPMRLPSMSELDEFINSSFDELPGLPMPLPAPSPKPPAVAHTVAHTVTRTVTRVAPTFLPILPPVFFPSVSIDLTTVA